MKISLNELKTIVREAIVEAKKKKKKEKSVDGVKRYQKDEKLDFSKPLGNSNLYKRQGASGIGPYTAESALRLFIKNVIKEAMKDEKSEKKK